MFINLPDEGKFRKDLTLLFKWGQYPWVLNNKVFRIRGRLYYLKCPVERKAVTY